MKKQEWRLWLRKSRERQWKSSQCYDSFEKLMAACSKWLKENCNDYDIEIRHREIEVVELNGEGK